MRPAALLSLLAVVTTASACSSQPPTPKGQLYPSQLGAGLAGYATEVDGAQLEFQSLVRDASAGLTLDLSTQPANVDPAVVDTRLVALYAHRVNLLVAASQLLDAADESAAATGALVAPSGDVGAQRQGLVVALTFVAGMAIFAYEMLKSIEHAMDLRAGPLEQRLATAPQNELDVAATELSLPAGSTSTQVLDAFHALGAGDRNAARSRIEDRIDSGENGAMPLEASAVNAAIAHAAVDLGQTAVKCTVGASTAGTGGQLVPEVVAAVGGSEDAAAVVDLAVTATDNQPLDWEGRAVDVAVVDCDTSPTTIPPLGATMTADEARAALSDADLSNDDDAALALAHDMVSRLPSGATTNPDGLVTVDVPDHVHLAAPTPSVQGGTVHVPVPEIGIADVIVAPMGKPTLVTTVDTNGGGTITYDDGSGSGGGTPGMLPTSPPVVPTCPPTFTTTDTSYGIVEGVWPLSNQLPVMQNNGVFSMRCDYYNTANDPFWTQAFTLVWQPYDVTAYGMPAPDWCMHGWPSDYIVSPTREAAVERWNASGGGSQFDADTGAVMAQLLTDLEPLAYSCP